MDIKQLESFVYTVKYQSFSKAAEKIFLSQPTISMHINTLEKELGTKLISRTTRDFTVTADGLKLYRYALGMLELKNKAIADITGVDNEYIHIGAAPNISVSILPEILTGFSEDNEDVEYIVETDDNREIMEKVADRTLDVGIVEIMDTGIAVDFEKLCTDQVVAIMPNTPHYEKLLVSKDPIKELIAEPVIIHEERSSVQQSLGQILTGKGYNINDIDILAKIDEPLSLYRSVELGLGVAVASKLVIDKLFLDEEILYFPLEDSYKDLYIVTPEGRKLPDLIGRFVDHMRSYRDH